MVPLNKRNGLFGRISADDELTTVDDQPADFSAGLTSLGFVKGAIRRGVWFWGTLALTGLLLGVGLYMSSPPVYQATTTLVLKVGPEAAPGTAIQNEQVVAQSRPVAGLALKKLKLPPDVASFLQSYTVTVLTDQALVFTVDAPSSTEAVTRARALAAAFLQFRASAVEAQQKSYFQALDQGIKQQKLVITTLGKQIRQVTAQPPSAAKQGTLSTLQGQRQSANHTLATLVQNFDGEKASIEEVTAQQVQESRVVNPAAAVAQSGHARLKNLILYGLVGLIVGLALGLAIVIVRALISDRLRRRDDITYVLGAPVRLSVGRVEHRRWRPGPRGLAAIASIDVQRIATHLRRSVRRNAGGPATLAVVSVDSDEAAALSMVALALFYADRGQRVIVADLIPHRPAARLAGEVEPGTHMRSVDGKQVVMVVPQPDDDMPIGPLTGTPRKTQPVTAKAAESADVLLTLVSLDPSFGAEHLPTWAADAVVLVTAGRSSWTRIHAAGEMIRLADVRLLSAVLVGADKTDESLGLGHPPGADRDVRAGAEGARVDPERSLVTLDIAKSDVQPEGK